MAKRKKWNIHKSFFSEKFWTDSVLPPETTSRRNMTMWRLILKYFIDQQNVIIRPVIEHSAIDPALGTNLKSQE